MKKYSKNENKININLVNYLLINQKIKENKEKFNIYTMKKFLTMR